MLKIENTEVLGWDAAIRGMRNPLNSWEKSDSQFVRDPDYGCFGVCPCAELVDCDCCHVGPMTERNDSHLLDGGDSVGMTDNQYKGMLLDQLEDWQEILDMAIAAGNTEIQKKAEKQIAKINEKLKF